MDGLRASAHCRCPRLQACRRQGDFLVVESGGAGPCTKRWQGLLPDAERPTSEPDLCLSRGKTSALKSPTPPEYGVAMSGIRIPRHHAPLAGLLLRRVLPLLNAADARKPNFIFMNIDDLGYADVGPFGSRLNRTPRPDWMAAEGRKLTCFHTAPAGAPWATFPIWNR